MTLCVSGRCATGLRHRTISAAYAAFDGGLYYKNESQSQERESNPQPTAYRAVALPVELSGLERAVIAYRSIPRRIIPPTPIPRHPHFIIKHGGIHYIFFHVSQTDILFIQYWKRPSCFSVYLNSVVFPIYVLRLFALFASKGFPVIHSYNTTALTFQMDIVNFHRLPPFLYHRTPKILCAHG